MTPASPPWQPAPDEIDRVHADQNPWHADGVVPSSLAPSGERSLARGLWPRLLQAGPRRFQLILGPRRAGKTTVMHQTVHHLLSAQVPRRQVWWMRLDHPLLQARDLGDLVRAVVQAAAPPQGQTVYLFLDELVYARDWDLWLKTFYDDAWPVTVVGTSSATAALRRARLESGVGRWEEQYLSPCLLTEFLALEERPVAVPEATGLAEALQAAAEAPPDLTGLPALRRRYLLTGGFPELLLAGRIARDADETTRLLESQRILRDDAVERAVYKDIPQAFGVDNPMLLERLLYLLAGQVTGLLSPTNICRDLDGLSQPTFDRYLSYLEQAFLVFSLPNYAGSESARQRRGRKLYFVDGAVRNAALQRGIGPLTDTREMGLLLENLVASHLHALARQAQVRLYHWRRGDQEVDLIYDHPEQPMAFEVASGLSHDRGPLRQFLAEHPRFQGRVWLVAPEVAPRPPAQAADGIGVVPLDLFLAVAGTLSERLLMGRLGG